MTDEQIIDRARKSYPNATSDTDALCRLITYLSGLKGERLDAMNTATSFLSMNIALQKENDRLRELAQ